FTEVPFLDRFARAAAAGFSAVEFLFPYPYAVGDLRAALDRHRLSLVLHNLPAGDWDAGERGIACLPGRTEEFRAGVETAIRYAQALGVPRLNCLVGKTPPGEDPARVHATLVDNVRHAANALDAVGLQLLVEAINPFDIPGFHLTTTAQVLALLDEVGSPNVRVQYDIYHAQRAEGELAGTLSRHLARIGHVQLADNPGRHEPGTGEINYPFLFAHLDRIGYDGYIGCEYKPAGVTEAGLGWMTALTA
ncbi:MAG TPA: hydroxypyruvate isomerase, partial [Gemmatimonadaceae bacterium]|nr:hydroxypyruvate isomerase [Gemmatimonadaceae bacterium]